MQNNQHTTQINRPHCWEEPSPKKEWEFIKQFCLQNTDLFYQSLEYYRLYETGGPKIGIFLSVTT